MYNLYRFYKILFRYLYNPVVFILAPLGVMVVLSSAFSQLLKKYEAPEEMKVGYRMEAAGVFASYLDELVEAGYENYNVTNVPQDTWVKQVSERRSVVCL